MPQDKKTDAADQKIRDERKGKQRQEDKIDEAVEESFPASDPPSTSDPSRRKR